MALIAGFAVAIFFYIVIGVVAGAAGADVDNLPAGVEIGATVIQDAALIGSALFFARMVGRPTAGQFGLRPAALWSVGWAGCCWPGWASTSSRAVWSRPGLTRPTTTSRRSSGARPPAPPDWSPSPCS